ncbi:MAG: VCBS repeat-containing protein [Desulfobacterales bacterium]|nr:VCBS repeat-containing protein [Desulfobacterales bacterium]
MERPGQLPHSRIAQGHGNIAFAWLAGPTDRYGHGVLGDGLEASRLVVETVDGKRLHVDLPHTRVFEDLEPRLADVTGDDNDDILVVESDTRSGASLSVYSIVDGRLVRIAATPFIGQANRWLNPVGAGDFDGDGNPDIALVATPHIGGKLRLYHVKGATLTLFAEYSGVSTHRIGSTELGLGRVVSARPRDRLLVPNQARRAMMLLEWSPDGWQEIARVALPGNLGFSLVPLDAGRWRFRSESGKYFEIQLKP